MKTTTKSKVQSLEAGRGVAALLVVLFHAWHHCRAAYGDFWLGHLFSFGHAGVDFFFVLSGFIILHAHRRDIGKPSRLMNFLKRRFTRIYPLYWFLLALTIAAAFFSSRSVFPAGAIIESALLMPTRGYPIMTDAWTLQHEVLFYGIFAALILSRFGGSVIFIGWLLILIFVRFSPIPIEDGLTLRLTSTFDFEFFLGMAASWISQEMNLPAPKLITVIGLASFLAIGVAENLTLINYWSFFTHFGYGLSAAVLVCGLVAWERTGTMLIPTLLVVVGDASYTLYLIHLLVIGALWQMLSHLGLNYELSASTTYIFLVVGATLAALAVRNAIEKPITARVRSLSKQPPLAHQPQGAAR
jgi:exopolysaccharide production protein ExoZ